jgi:hypothetical protein
VAPSRSTPRSTPAPAHSNPAAATVAATGLDFGGGVADLSAGDVQTLMNGLDQVSAIPDAEPGPVVDPLDDQVLDDGGAR